MSGEDILGAGHSALLDSRNREVTPNQVFEAVVVELSSRGQRSIENYNEKVHTAFRQAREEFPHEMRGFNISGKAYSPTLNNLFSHYRNSDILGASDSRH